MAPIYYRDAKGAILVYDISIPETFKRVQKWVEELKAFNKNAVIIIAGNKIDLKKHFENQKEIASNYVEEENIKLFYTSAKTGEGVEEIFQSVTKDIADGMASQKNNKSLGKKLQLTKKNEPVNEGCCK